MLLQQSSRCLFRLIPKALVTRSYSRSSPMAAAMSSLPSSFQAWRVEQNANDGSFSGREQTMTMDSLPNNNNNNNGVLIKVMHSSLNYKDALSASGNKGVTRKYPHTPGIDASGQVVEISESHEGEPASSLHQGDLVLVTGYDLGMNTDGGFGEYIRVPKDWVVEMPKNWVESDPTNLATVTRTAMIYGTAGLTAGLCVEKLLQMGGATPSQGKVLVTGASGSVGSVAVEILSKLGFRVVAISSKDPALLETLGASEILGREELSNASKKTLLKPEYAHAIDTVGGSPLVELLKKIKPGGSVACCGLVAGAQLESATVLPFILRGVNLLGVDSVEISRQEKQKIWNKLSNEWACPETERTARDIGRHELDVCLKAFLEGKSYGKIVLDHSLAVD